MALHDLSLRVVLYEGPETVELPSETRFQAIQGLLSRGYAVSRAGQQRPLSPPDRSAMVVVGHFVDGTPSQDTVASDGTPLHWEGLEPENTGTLADRVAALGEKLQAVKPGEWKPWFPVIDYDRCTNCMQCLSFCLFGVYGVDEEKQIQVQTQDNCKTNCPACSRVCPEAAIMFPKYKAGPINGDEVSSDDLNREKMKIDISALLGGDIYSMLRTRSDRARSRFSKERDSDKALLERTKCLKKLGEMASDIPPEVLASLPSPDEIARRAEEAASRAKAAMANSSETK